MDLKYIRASTCCRRISYCQSAHYEYWLHS